MIPIIKSRCGWCHERYTFVDAIINRWYVAYRIARTFDHITTPIGKAWHNKFHDK